MDIVFHMVLHSLPNTHSQAHITLDELVQVIESDDHLVVLHGVSPWGPRRRSRRVLA